MRGTESNQHADLLQGVFTILDKNAGVGGRYRVRTCGPRCVKPMLCR